MAGSSDALQARCAVRRDASKRHCRLSGGGGADFERSWPAVRRDDEDTAFGRERARARLGRGDGVGTGEEERVGRDESHSARTRARVRGRGAGMAGDDKHDAIAEQNGGVKRAGGRQALLARPLVVARANGWWWCE